MATNEQGTSGLPSGENAIGELGDRYAKVSLEGEEDVGLEIVELDGENTVGAGVDLRWAAVGRFLADKSIKMEVMQQVMAAVWRPVKGVCVKKIENDRFIFKFFHEKDIQRILREGPWAFENATLVLKRLKEGDRVEFWVQVHDVPCGFMTERIAEQIGNAVGIFVQNDPNNFGGNWKSYMRIRVAIDINRPLRKKLKLRKNRREWVWVVFKYERLFTFCYFCGCVGHAERFCIKAMEADTPTGEYAYGPWLRAPVRRFATSVGERWLVKDEPLVSGDRVSGSCRGGSSGESTPKSLQSAS